MAAGHKPMRMCMSCRKRFYKPELTRFVREGAEFMSDPQQKKPGRGFYVCSSAECVAKMQKRLARPKGDLA